MLFDSFFLYRSYVGEDAVIGEGCIVGAGARVEAGARLDPGCVIGRGAVVGENAVLGDGASLDPGCHLGAGAFLGPGARLLDRTRLPTSEPGKPARVGDGTRIGGNAVVCGGITVGADAVVSAGDCVEDDVPDDGVWMGGRFVFSLWAPMELFIDNDCDNPDIKFDRHSPRNCDAAPNNPNIFAHIVWTELVNGKWEIMYAKYHPLDVDEDPEINGRALHPDQTYIVPLSKPDPELAITSENDIAIIYTAQTMGYESNDPLEDYYRVFYTLLDNNGVIRTTNTYISDNSNYDIVNSASAINDDDELFVAWDTFDPTIGDFLNTIKWRTHDWA